jgi:hypothetical protein
MDDLFSTRKVLDGALLSLVNYTNWSFDIDKYHEEVTTYEVKDEKRISLLFFTLFFQEKENVMALGWLHTNHNL